MKFLNKKIIKREVSLIHYLLLSTSKIMIGIGLGLIIASYGWFAYPHFYMILFLGIIMLLPILLFLMKEEEEEEIRLKHHVKGMKSLKK